MLPKGFKIDKKPPKGFTLDSLPKGFTIDKPEKPVEGLAKPSQQVAEDMMTQLVGLDRQPERPLMERQPTLWAAGKTALEMPRAIGELGEAIVSGATMGLSERAEEAGDWLSRKLFGEKRGGVTGTWKRSVLPEYVESGGKLLGAMAPVSAAGRVIAAPIIKKVVRSRYLAPFARMIGWGTAGAGYTGAEGMIREGELPTPKEIAEHGATWAAFEGAVSALGFAGRLTLGVTKLSRLWGIPKKEVLKIVTKEAKTKGIPIAKYAYTKAEVQKSLKHLEDLAKPFEKQGTYQDLVRQLSDQEISSRIKSFKDYTSKGIVIGEERIPKAIITKKPSEIERILQKPAFQRTAEDKIALRKVKIDIKYEPRIELREPKLFPEVKRPIPRLIEPITKVPIRREAPKLLPPGQEFILKPVTKLRKKPVPKPYEAVVEYKPVITKAGEPFKSMSEANKALKRKGLSLTEYTIIEHGKGYAIQRFGRKVKAKPSITFEFGGLQTVYETLVGKVKSRVKLRQNKYAGSVNVTKQKIKQPYKEFQKEVSALAPKKVQTWDMTGKLSKEIVADYKKSTKVLTKAKRGEALTAVEIDAVRQVNVNAINKLKEIAETKAPEQMNKYFTNYVDDVFKPLSNASSEAGRALNIHKKEVSVQRIAKAFSKIKKGLNLRQLKEFKELNLENPLETQRFLNRLPDPKLRDYFYEYWYNSILSGVPTHVVNVASNTGWAAFQLGIHRPFKAVLDIPIAAFTGRQRRYYLNETVPALLAYTRAFKKGAKGAKEMIMKGNISKFETKWAREVGSSVLGAFERSPHKALRKAAPFISAPTRALRAMDIWANTMAYDSHIAALARRAANVKRLKGKVRKTFEQKLILNPTDEMRTKSTHFAKHLTFTDDPGKFTEWIIQGRDKVPFGRLVVPFVNTIANLTKRGIEMTPGIGLLLARGKTPATIIGKQIEGTVLGLYILSKIDKGEITGRAPKEKAKREAFYRQGKKPWGIKMDGTWYQYRRIEPFNTSIASVAIAYDAIQNAKDDATRTEIFGTMVEGLAENVIDSSYLQGLTNILDKYGRRKGMLERTAASFVPYSSFWRSINRAYDVATEGKTVVRDTKSLLGAFSQVIPGLSDIVPARLNVWGEEIPIEGGVFRQWLPYKWSKEKPDATEKMLESLEIYPGLPKQNVTIQGKKVKLPDNIYKNYCLSYGHKAKKILDKVISNPSFKLKNDKLKIKQLNNILTQIRYRELQRAKYEFKKKQQIKSLPTNSLPKGFKLD